MTDSGGYRWWSTPSTEVETLDGEPMEGFVVFAAPEDDIDTWTW